LLDNFPPASLYILYSNWTLTVSMDHYMNMKYNKSIIVVYWTTSDL